MQRYRCDQCGRSYKHKTNLCNHKREECGKPPSYFCPVCKKGFKKKQHLQRHLVVHNTSELCGQNIDKDLLKCFLPQQLTTAQNEASKTSGTLTSVPPQKQDAPVNSSSLPPLSVFPNSVFPYPSMFYPNQFRLNSNNYQMSTDIALNSVSSGSQSSGNMI